jgi:hypothetical protein
MIIENQAAVTDAVIEAFGRTEDLRLREILLASQMHPITSAVNLR